MSARHPIAEEDDGSLLMSASLIVRVGTIPEHPGACYADLEVRHAGDRVAIPFGGYVYAGHEPTYPGEYEGPSGGPGNPRYRTIADDIAPADITTTLAVTNAFTRIDGFIWYYHCSGDVADRTLRALLRDVGTGLPTGMTSGINTTPRAWPNSAVLTLSANEEGMIYSSGIARPAYSAIRDDGSITIENNASAPTPFPLWVRADDIASIFFDVSLEEASDRHSIFLIQESWLVASD